MYEGLFDSQIQALADVFERTFKGNKNASFIAQRR